MGAVVLDITMSLDGFVAGPNDEIDPIHDWVIVSPTTSATLSGVLRTSLGPRT